MKRRIENFDNNWLANASVQYYLTDNYSTFIFVNNINKTKTKRISELGCLLYRNKRHTHTTQKKVNKASAVLFYIFFSYQNF